MPTAARPLTAADLPRVAEIERATFADPWSQRAFEETIARPGVTAYALDDAGRLAGYALCSLAADEGEILNIAVATEARGRGAGLVLMRAMLAGLRAGGARQVFLEVRRSNEAAIALYRRVGFRDLATRRAYYSRPREDALTMVLDVTQNTAL